MKKHLPLTGLLTIVLLTSACGSSEPSPEDAVRDVATQFAVSAGSQDMATTCSLLTADLFEQMGGDSDLGCATMDGPGVWGDPALKGLTVAGVSVSGENATVSFEGSPISLLMEKEGEAWRISEVN